MRHMKTKLPVVLVASLLWQFGPTAAQQLPASKIHADQCSVVLNDVKAGRDISINIKCDVPTERQILSALLKDKFTSECFFATPAKWTKLHPIASVELHSIPLAGDYFSQFDFRYIAYQAEQLEVEKTFIFGRDVIPGGEVSSPWMNDNRARILKLRDSNPGYIVSDHVLQRANNFDYFALKDALAKAQVRSNIHYEDGSQVETGQLYVFKEEKLVSQLIIFPTPNPYPRLSDDVTAYTFRCEADVAMKPQIFADLCAGLIERTTLAQSFANRSCQHSGVGSNRRYIFAPAP